MSTLWSCTCRAARPATGSASTAPCLTLLRPTPTTDRLGKHAGSALDKRSSDPRFGATILQLRSCRAAALARFARTQCMLDQTLGPPVRTTACCCAHTSLCLQQFAVPHVSNKPLSSGPRVPHCPTKRERNLSPLSRGTACHTANTLRPASS